MLKIPVMRLGLMGLLVTVLAGCQIWPFMSDEDGRRPVAMGKNDQIMYPYTLPPVHLSEDFGQSFVTARENQIVNPQASKNLEPVTELDGVAAGEAMNRYQQLFKQPPFVRYNTGGARNFIK